MSGTAEAKIPCVTVTRPETHPGLFCTWKLKDFDVHAEMDGCEVGDEIVLTYCEMTAKEFEDLGDFDGW